MHHSLKENAKAFCKCDGNLTCWMCVAEGNRELYNEAVDNHAAEKSRMQCEIDSLKKTLASSEKALQMAYESARSNLLKQASVAIPDSLQHIESTLMDMHPTQPSSGQNGQNQMDIELGNQEINFHNFREIGKRFIIPEN